MRAVVLGLAMLAAGPAMAEGKVWVDEWCAYSVESGEKGFAYFNNASNTPERTCAVEDWPVESPKAILRCDTGEQATMELPDDATLLWNNIPFYVSGDPRVKCD